MIEVYPDGTADGAHLVDAALAPFHLRRVRIRVWDGFRIAEERVGRLRWSYRWWFLLLDDGRHWSRLSSLGPDEHWEIEPEPDRGYTHVGPPSCDALSRVCDFVRESLMGWMVDLELTQLPVRDGSKRLGQAGAVFEERGVLHLRRPSPFEPVEVYGTMLEMAWTMGAIKEPYGGDLLSPCVVSVAPAVR